MAMPASQRRLCAGNLVITISVSLHPALSQDRCLWVYPEAEWNLVEAELNRIPASNVNGMKLRRALIGSAHDVELDDSGRLLIPPHLRTYAGLDRDVMLVGQGRKLELWDAAVWGRNLEQLLQDGFLEQDGQLSPELQALVL